MALSTAALLLLTLDLPGQSSDATLEFSVQAAPTGGRPEKVMQHPFYLLRASLQEIEKVARQQTTPPDLNAFIEELTVSPELKEWMKDHQTVGLQGDAFLSSLAVDEVMDVPEFRQAYVTHNLSMVGLGFPKRKAKLTDREKHPAKWEKSEKRYWEEVRSYLVLHPESKAGMEEHLLDITAAHEWSARTQRYEQEVRQRVLQMVHSHYLVARTETDWEGFARLRGLAPGRYWLSNLWHEVRAGDTHLSWELPVELRPGQTLYLELNNANARFPPPAPNLPGPP